MKKTKHTSSSAKKKDLNAPDRPSFNSAGLIDRSSRSTAQNRNEPIDDEEQGFGGWLRSPDGLETMKLFVIANSIVMLTTIVFPHIQTVVEIVKDLIYGESPDEYE